MSDKNHHKRAAIVRIALICIAVLPIILGSLQVLHFCFWLFDWDYSATNIFYLMKFSATALLFSFIISIYERFCIFHRITILSTLYANSSYIFMDLFPTICSYNITNLCAIAGILLGIAGCFYHFSLQITDFIRYVRIQSAK